MNKVAAMVEFSQAQHQKTGKKDSVTGEITKQNRTLSDYAMMSDAQKLAAFGIGRAFHFFRLRFDMKKRTASNLIPTTNQRYRFIENGETIISDVEILAFCKGLGIDTALFAAKAAEFEKLYVPKLNRKKKKKPAKIRIGKPRHGDMATNGKAV
ncbi:hypothetical protein [Bartonella sp. LJL80]